MAVNGIYTSMFIKAYVAEGLNALINVRNVPCGLRALLYVESCLYLCSYKCMIGLKNIPIKCPYI